MSDTPGIIEEPRRENILGLSTAAIADLTTEELVGNETAIKMLLHYYRKLVDENTTLKNEKNTLDTYVVAYSENKTNSATGAVLLTISNISIGFGVNLLTGSNIWPGIASLIIGIALVFGGIYFTFIKGKK
jgi:hypothetical protein